MKKLYLLFLSALIAVTIISCDGKSKKQKKAKKEVTTVKIDIPAFNEDSAYAYIEQQVAFGPRVPNTIAHTKCAAFLADKLKTFTPNVVTQEARVRAFDGTILHAKNIIASFNPKNNSRVLLCAHWDSRPFADHDPDKSNHRKPIDGANDGASGVGVLLEIARQLSIKMPSVGIDIIFFDAEDYGEPQGMQTNKEDTWGLGSQYWSKNPHKPGYNARYGILLDMVGAKNATFPREGTSMYYAPDIVRKVWLAARNAGYRNFFLDKDVDPIVDDHSYINALIKIPTIDIIHLDESSPKGFFPYWHTTKDDMSNIDKQTLKAVGQTVLKVIFEEGADS